MNHELRQLLRVRRIVRSRDDLAPGSVRQLLKPWIGYVPMELPAVAGLARADGSYSNGLRNSWWSANIEGRVLD